MVEAAALGSTGFSGWVGEGRACPSWVMVLFAEAGGSCPLQQEIRTYDGDHLSGLDCLQCENMRDEKIMSDKMKALSGDEKDE